MKKTVKILIAGVGGQGVVFLTSLLVKASMIAGIDVRTSEVHGLAQRGGSVKSGITFGEGTKGFIEKGGVDVLLGLEPLEAQRCVSFLNKNSTVIIDDNKIFPSAVNVGVSEYPDTFKFVDFLKKNVHRVIYLDKEMKAMKPRMRNLYVLGVASNLEMFPFGAEYIKQAIKETVKKGYEKESLEVFESALKVINKDKLAV